MILNEDSSDDEYGEILLTLVEKSMKDEKSHRRGSIKGHAIIPRPRILADRLLYVDYFADNPVYPTSFFRRRYSMKRPLFMCIHDGAVRHDSYFVQKRNVAGVLGLSSLQKTTAAVRLLAYGVPADNVDEYLKIGESTTIESLKIFVRAVVEVFGDEYLRSSDDNDIKRLLTKGVDRGFPGMLGSIDCHCHEPTIILEAVASYDLWIWHAFFGLPRSHNDINVLDRSPVFADLAKGRDPKVEFKWPTFVKTISSLQGKKQEHFATLQEAYRKDVEQAFGVLQARCAIIRGPARFWNQEDLKDIMTACNIMHNMIIEDE